jgi:hypothetical protein
VASEPLIKRIRFGHPDGTPALCTALCTILPDLSDPFVSDAITIEWLSMTHRHCSISVDESSTLIVDERAVRGAEWLEGRWRVGGVRFKHMGVAVKAAGVSREEFPRRWRAHAGRSGGTTIPEGVRGRAYVQNHPVQPGPYDAINEVWFDDLEGLRRRVDWFRENPPADPLFSRFWLLAVREEALGEGS